MAAQMEQLKKAAEQAVSTRAWQLQPANDIATPGAGPAADEPPQKGLALSGFLELARFFSTQASAANRSLALGGIAIIWLFKKPEKGPIVSGLLNLPLFFLALSLALDLLQYFIGGAAWNWFYERKYREWERQRFNAAFAKDIEAPNYISRPITWLFYLKIMSMVAAYFFIIRYLVGIL